MMSLVTFYIFLIDSKKKRTCTDFMLLTKAKAGVKAFRFPVCLSGTNTGRSDISEMCWNGGTCTKEEAIKFQSERG